MTLYVMMCILPCVVVIYICVTLGYVRECVWKCGVMVIIHEFAYFEQVYILNIFNSLNIGLGCALYLASGIILIAFFKVHTVCIYGTLQQIPIKLYRGQYTGILKQNIVF